MKIKDIIKKQTTIIAIAVVLVTLALIGVSYAIFFDVKTNTDNQVITAGTLELNVTGISALTLTDPVSTTEGLKTSPITYTAVNTDSNLPAAYSLYIYAGDNNTIDLNMIKVSTDGNSSSGSTAKTLGGITDTLEENGKTYYKISNGTLAAGASGTTQYLRIWLDESLISDEISNATLNLQLYVVSEVDES